MLFNPMVASNRRFFAENSQKLGISNPMEQKKVPEIQMGHPQNLHPDQKHELTNRQLIGAPKKKKNGAPSYLDITERKVPMSQLIKYFKAEIDVYEKQKQQELDDMLEKKLGKTVK